MEIYFRFMLYILSYIIPFGTSLMIVNRVNVRGIHEELNCVRS